MLILRVFSRLFLKTAKKNFSISITGSWRRKKQGRSNLSHKIVGRGQLWHAWDAKGHIHFCIYTITILLSTSEGFPAGRLFHLVLSNASENKGVRNTIYELDLNCGCQKSAKDSEVSFPLSKGKGTRYEVEGSWRCCQQRIQNSEKLGVEEENFLYLLLRSCVFTHFNWKCSMAVEVKHESFFFFCRWAIQIFVWCFCITLIQI
jgi:hypothetical protein